MGYGRSRYHIAAVLGYNGTHVTFPRVLWDPRTFPRVLWGPRTFHTFPLTEEKGSKAALTLVRHLHFGPSECQRRSAETAISSAALLSTLRRDADSTDALTLALPSQSSVFSHSLSRAARACQQILYQPPTALVVAHIQKSSVTLRGLAPPLPPRRASGMNRERAREWAAV